MADEVKAGYGGTEVNPVRFREKVDSWEQFVSDAVGGVQEVSLGLSQRAAECTLGKGQHTRMLEKKQMDNISYRRVLSIEYLWLDLMCWLWESMKKTKGKHVCEETDK